MKLIERRLRKLDNRFGPPVETAFSRMLQQRIEAGRQRLKEAEERGLYQPPEKNSLQEARRRRYLEAMRFRI